MRNEYTNANRWLLQEVERQYPDDENLNDLKWLVRRFYKSATANGQTTYKMIEGQGSSRTITEDGIVQSFRMKFNYIHPFFGRDDDGARKAFQLIPFVLGEIYKPDSATLLRGFDAIFFNTYVSPEILPDPNFGTDNDGPFREFLERLFPDEEQRKFFLQWMAATVVHPNWFIDMAPLLRSEQGVGKNLLWDRLIKPLVGARNAPVVGLSQLTDDYAGDLYHSTAIMVDEVYSNKKASADRLKPLITMRDAFVNVKYQPQYRADVNFNVLITSNTDVPLYIEDGDRRYWVPDFIRHKVSGEETAEWIAQELIPWLDATGIHIIRNILEEVAQGLEEKMFSRAPDTKAKQTIISQDLKPVRKEHLREFLTYRRDFRFDMVSIQRHETFKYLSQGDIREVLGEAEFARFDEKRQMFVGKRRRDAFSGKGGPETFEHISTKRTEHLPLWTIELERSGKVWLTTEDEIKKHEISKIVVVG